MDVRTRQGARTVELTTVLSNIPRLAAALIAVALLFGIPSTRAADVAEVRLAYLAQHVERPPALSNLQWLRPPEDEGLQGARLGVDDNNTTGRFTKQRFILTEKVLPADGDVAAAFAALAAEGHRFFVVDLPAAALDAVLAMPEAGDMLIFNAGAADDRFRNADCRARLLHTLPSRAMLADALTQYLVKRRWSSWFLITGTHDADGLFADAMRRSAQRFGAKVDVEKTWTFTHDARRTAEAEVPVFTQVEDHDVLVVADDADLFGDQLLYRTWEPRPVAGTQGLVPVAWHRTVEQWGAAQLHSRFLKQAGRWMNDKDYAAWVAVRSVGEAATRTKSVTFDDIDAFIRSDQFDLAAFKGRKVSYRPWNGQLRQPIPLVWSRSLVSMSPQEGFLHPRTDLDTLGYDEAESACSLN